MATTLFDSFSTQLPNVQNGNPEPYPSASESGTIAARTDAPPMFATKAAAYALVGNNIIGAAQIQTTLQNLYLAPTDQTMIHYNEGDVVRSASVYLLNPVNVALSVHQSNRVRCVSETSANKMRTDILYRRISGSGGPNRTFAILEFKRQGVFAVDDFRSATKPATQIASFEQKASNRPESTYFMDNALKVIKQAAAYAIQHRTQYVALFDWGLLVMVRFVDLDLSKDDDTLVDDGVGTRCTLDLVPLARSQTMRLALLGFLAEAYDNTPQ
jgi:hypothetical protein